MAVDPQLQELTQTTLVRATIGVVCNVREDHLAEMGPTIDDVARSLSRTMPAGGVCVTGERDRLARLRQHARDRRCRLVAAGAVTPAELVGFAPHTFADNVAVALAVAQLAGIDRAAALAAMRQAPPGPGTLTVDEFGTGSGRLRVANLFAANDPESTRDTVRALVAQEELPPPRYLLINCRPDRIDRNRQMGALVPQLAPHGVFLIGAPTRSAHRAIPPRWRDRVTDLGGRPPAQLLDAILARAGRYASVIAVGNIHGAGEQLLQELATLEPVPAATGGPR